MTKKVALFYSRRKIDLTFDEEYINELAKEMWDVLVRNKPQIAQDQCVFNGVGFTTCLDFWVNLEDKFPGISGTGEVTPDMLVTTLGLINNTLYLTKTFIEASSKRKTEFQKLVLKGLWDAYLFACRERDN